MRQLLKHCSYQSNTQVCIVALCGLCSPRRGLVSSAGQELSAFIPSTAVFNALPVLGRSPILYGSRDKRAMNATTATPPGTKVRT